MYTIENFRSKAELKRAVAAGKRVETFQPGPFPAKTSGTVALEGPHYPEAHKWYASAVIQDGVIVAGSVK